MARHRSTAADLAERPPSFDRRRLLGRLGLLAGSSTLTLACGEWLLRMLAPSDPPIRLGQFAEVVEGRHGISAAEIFESDPELFWRLRPDVTLPADARPLFGTISNGRGLREDRELGPKTQREVRVLCLGDSCTFGYLVALSDAFPRQVEAGLRRRFPDRPVTCLNAGVPGYSLFQGCRLLETEGAHYRPDLVVASFGWNDAISWDGRGDLEHHEAARRRRPPGPLARSLLCRRIWELQSRAPAGAAEVSDRPRLFPHEFRRLLDRTERAAQSAGAELLLLVWGARPCIAPGPFRDYRTPLQEEQYRHASGRTFGPDRGPAVVDGVAVFQELAGRLPGGEIFLDGIHGSAAAHGAIAAALVARIGPWLRARGEGRPA